MIRKLLATTALAALVTSGAYAQDTTTPAPAIAPAPATAPATENAAPVAPVVQADGSLVANIVGESVYNGAGDNAESIGKVSDVVFDKDGQAKQLIIGVGGFLGVGTKTVAFDYDKLKWAEKNGDRWLVAETTKEALTALPDFDATPYEPAPAVTPSADTGMAPAPSADSTAPATPDAATAPANTAQSAPADVPAAPVDMAQGLLASKVIGESVYNGPAADAEKIGSVNDIVLNKEGKAEQYVIGVGGFLGVGQKNVAVDFGKASWVEKNGDRWIIVEASKDELKGLPEFDRKPYDPAPSTAAAGSEAPAAVTPAIDTTANKAAADATSPAATGEAAQAPAADTTADKPADATAPAATGETAQAPAASNDTSADAAPAAAIDKSTLTEVPADKISADNLIGTTVYGADDAKVGEIGDVVLSSDNQIDAIVIDVGGFLGIGEKPVAVGMDKLKFMNDKDGNQYLYTNFTKDQLKAQPAYDKDSYTEKRDEQRLILQ